MEVCNEIFRLFSRARPLCLCLPRWQNVSPNGQSGGLAIFILAKFVQFPFRGSGPILPGTRAPKHMLGTCQNHLAVHKWSLCEIGLCFFSDNHKHGSEHAISRFFTSFRSYFGCVESTFYIKHNWK